MWRIREGIFFTFIKGKVFHPQCVCVCMCWSWYVCLFGRRPTRRQASKHHKKETIHRHQHDEEKNLQISIACACICKNSCVCDCEWVKKNQQRKIFVEENFLFIFNFHYLHLISSCMCTHIFKRKLGKWEELSLRGVDVGGWQITAEDELWYAEREVDYTHNFQSPSPPFLSHLLWSSSKYKFLLPTQPIVYLTLVFFPSRIVGGTFFII